MNNYFDDEFEALMVEKTKEPQSSCFKQRKMLEEKLDKWFNENYNLATDTENKLLKVIKCIASCFDIYDRFINFQKEFITAPKNNANNNNNNDSNNNSNDESIKESATNPNDNNNIVDEPMSGIKDSDPTPKRTLDSETVAGKVIKKTKTNRKVKPYTKVPKLKKENNEQTKPEKP